MRSKFFLFFIFGLICLIGMPLINAVPPITSEFIGDQGLDIQANFMNYYKTNEGASLQIFVFNRSNGVLLDNSSVSCRVWLSNSNGTILLYGSPTPQNDYFIMSRPANIIQDDGIYGVTIVCNDTVGGYKTHFFEATVSGEEPTTAKAIFYIGLLFLLIIFFIVSLYGFAVTEQLWSKTGSLGIAYLLLIAISFIAWSMSANFMTSATFIIAFLRILFIVFIAGLFPVLIGLFCYGFWMMIQIDEIKKLQDQGFDTEEAAEKVKKRRKF